MYLCVVILGIFPRMIMEKNVGLNKLIIHITSIIMYMLNRSACGMLYICYFLKPKLAKVLVLFQSYINS